MEDIVKKNKVKIAVIAIPPDEVQFVVDRLVNVGVKGFLSLALVPINVPDDVDVSFFDILSEVEFLFLKLNLKELL
jgi:redox-sensing transcriptional repressor